MFAWLKQLGRTEYVGLIEAELVRLRAENRALTNSLLGTAGFPPVHYPAEPLKPAPIPRVRRRSWLQLQAWRETISQREEHAPQETAGLSERPILKG